MTSEEKLDLNKLRLDVENEIQNEKHGKIAKICRTVLASKPNELLWLRLLCCAMIHLSETTPLLKFIETYSNKHQIYNALLFYKIYCLYLLKENEKAKELILKNSKTIKTKLTKEEQIATQYLQYQIFYRLGEYQSALNILDALSTNNNNNNNNNKDNQYLNEIAVNKISTLIAMNNASKAIDEYYDNNNNMNILNRNCDFVFNLATSLILCCKINEAKSFLLSSLTNCAKAMKEEDYDEKEIESEIGNLELLIAYCLYSEGDIDGASEYYNRLSSKQQINGIYQNLILQNNCLMVNDEDIKNDNNKQLILYKKLLNNKNKENFSRIGNDENGLSQLIKTYHNQCIILIKNNNKTNHIHFKQLIAEIKNKKPLSEIPLFLKISYHLNQNQYQQCKDILSHHLSSNPNASIKSNLMYIQILINMKKYKMAIQEIRDLVINKKKMQFTENMINVLLEIVKKLNDKKLMIQIIKEIIEYLQKMDNNNSIPTNKSLLISLQIKVCQLLISINKPFDAKKVANDLYEYDPQNTSYKAMLLLTAIHTQDMDLAQKISSEIELNVEYNQFDIDDLLNDIPNIKDNDNDNDDDENEIFSFEINEEIELKRKREINRRKREKNAMKLRKKYKENPELYRDPINWESNKNKKSKKNKWDENKGKHHNKNVRKQKGKKESPKKKKKGFRGAQGGSGTSNKFQVYDINDPQNKNKQTGKTVIPQHIKKKRKRG